MEKKTNIKREKVIQHVKSELAQDILDCNETVMTLEDAGTFLGKSREAVKKMCQRGMIPAHKNGKTWYLLKSEVVQRLRLQ